MASALIHIAIFSKSYADSPWCLAELSIMLKSGAKIIPIFYHVEPSDLRWVDQGKRMYVQAFKEHERKGRYSQEQLHEWKSAHQTVSFYTGQIIKTNEILIFKCFYLLLDEMRLLKNIVSSVLKEINNNVLLVVAKHPVVLKEIVEDFKVNLLQPVNANHNVQIIGIWGMGGSSKTTVAKELYNEISSSMERKCLLHQKQKKLLNDLCIKDLAIDNIEEGMASLSRGLRYVRVLIVLDDVDNMEQLDASLPTKDKLEKGSRIIVTTWAYDHVLKSWGISSIYKMRQLYRFCILCKAAFLLACFHKILST
ncbi:hypothetical protein SUGI_0560220 [Cryptomeria japonica]|nr:hypothetical protein SUGI_0560220 [Cryptomeria japonica]